MLCRTSQVRQRWVPCCVVLGGLDPDTELARVQLWVSGRQVTTAQFPTILDPARDGRGTLILAQEQVSSISAAAARKPKKDWSLS